MSNIKIALGKLKPEDQKALIFAFEQIQPFYIIIENRFVGVHLTFEPKLVIEEQQGVWSIGSVK